MADASGKGNKCLCEDFEEPAWPGVGAGSGADPGLRVIVRTCMCVCV